MASKELIEAVNEYDAYLIKTKKKNGEKAMYEAAFKANMIDAYTKACSVALNTEKDLDYGLKLSRRVKNMCNRWAKVVKEYDDILHLARKNSDVDSIPVKSFYEILYLEAPYLFDSYMIYIDKDRSYKRNFYAPRLKC